ncbi:MAG: DHH family phosphoesterase [Candidatus Nealsonbacteria bacterium]|nr:DHH family phosphoesterase [Candidatus Nealsonbacteria bacterium]
MINWPRFVEIVSKNQRFVLTTHIRPDCDALGSLLAMAAVLESLGKEVLALCDFQVPPNLAFLDAEGRVKQLGVEVPAEEAQQYDVLIVLDTSAWAQLGKMGDVIRAFQGVKAVLDHHVSGDELGAEWFKNTTAEATGRLVAEAADQLGAEITPEIARGLFAALTTDTGWFRFSSTKAETLRLGGRLIDAGAVPDLLYQQLYEDDTLARLQLVGRAMARTKTELDGRLIHTYMERVDFEQVGAHPADSEDVINMTLAVGGTEAAVILVEQKTGGFKISFRSRCDLDCSRVAEQFGGGGHKKAAGAFIDEPLESAQAKVLEAVRKAMQ